MKKTHEAMIFASGLTLVAAAACSSEVASQIDNENSRVTESANQSNSSDLPTFTYTELPEDGVLGAVTTYRDMSVEEVSALEHCGKKSDKILLTFDDYGSKEHVAEIAQTLKAENIGALFFPITSRTTQDTFDYLRGEGFWIGNHTTNHPNMVGLDDATITSEILNGTTTNIYRPPYGAIGVDKDGVTYFDPHSSEIAADFDFGKNRALGKVAMKTCLWTVDSVDYGSHSAQEITNRVMKNMHVGAVVLMHQQDEYFTLDALPEIIKQAREQGYEFCEHPGAPTTFEIPENYCD